jgi:hypothetical protein
MDFQSGLFSKARWGLPLGEEGRTVVGGVAGLNEFDGCVPEVETVIEGL